MLGHPSYYPRFGYVHAKTFGIQSPFDVPDECFMAINLQDKSTNLNAIVEYPKEFFDYRKNLKYFFVSMSVRQVLSLTNALEFV